MIEPCNYDSLENSSHDKIAIIKTSDCYDFCISSGCTLELLENDKCDAGKIYIECNIQECAWDLGQCGFCAKNCYENMLGDGNCDEECNIAECRYDLNDCECAPNCKLEDYGKCKPECMVPDCNYDSITTTCPNEDLREFYKYWQLLNYDFSITKSIDLLNCSSENFIYCQLYKLYKNHKLLADNCADGCLKCTSNWNCVDCDYSKGYINFFDTCVKSCPEGYSNHFLVPSICYRNQESVKIYVDYNTTKSIINGSQKYPYKTLYDAISKANSPFIEILLKPGIHQIYYEIPINPIIVSITIKSDCTDHCPEYAFLNITNSLFSFPTSWALSITFLNLIIDRKSISNPYTNYDMYRSGEICPQVQFFNLTEIKSKAKFYAENVTFQNILYNIRSVISANNSRIELHNTNFINILTFHCFSEFSVVILSGDSNLTSSFIYESGIVALNYKIYDTALSYGSSFLASKGYKNIKVTDVELNNVWAFKVWGISSINPGSNCKSLFCIYDCEQIVLTNNKFYNIYSEYHLLDIKLGSIYLDWESYVIVNNNQFDYLWSRDLLSLNVSIGASYIFIADLNISRALIDLDIIEIDGWEWNTEAIIKNIWISNSAFFQAIVSQNTKNLDISCIYIKNLKNAIWNFDHNQGITDYIDINSLKSRNGLPYYYLDTLIYAVDGIISISNITANKEDANVNSYLSICKIFNSSNFSLKNIRAEDMINSNGRYVFDIEKCKQTIIYNIFVKNLNFFTNFDVFHFEDNKELNVISSYFENLRIYIPSSETESRFLGIYDTIFLNSFIYFNDQSLGSNYQFINCSFLNWLYSSYSPIYAVFNESSRILTQNCIFKNNEKLIYLEGGNYQDINSTFELNQEGFDFNSNTANNTYLFSESKFYDNTYSLFDVEYGSMNFSNCIFTQSSRISTKSSLFIINSTFLNISDSSIEIKGSQSYIKDSYFNIYNGEGFINSLSPSFEIYNTTFVKEHNSWYGKIINIQESGTFLISNVNFTIDDTQYLIYSEENRDGKIENSYFNINQAY